MNWIPRVAFSGMARHLKGYVSCDTQHIIIHFQLYKASSPKLCVEIDSLLATSHEADIIGPLALESFTIAYLEIYRYLVDGSYEMLELGIVSWHPTHSQYCAAALKAPEATRHLRIRAQQFLPTHKGVTIHSRVQQSRSPGSSWVPPLNHAAGLRIRQSY